MRETKPRLFFVIEGNDGSGQTTQGKMLAAWLASQKILCWLTAEPTSSPAGQRVRRILGKKEEASAEITQDLFIEDRRGHVNQISLHLDRGEVVVSVRYLYSTLAYGTADGLNVEGLIEKNQNFLRPTAAFYLDLSADEARQRVEGRGKPKETFEEGEYPDKVHVAYNRLLDDPRFPELVRIDARGTPEGVHARIVAEVQKHLEEVIA